MENTQNNFDCLAVTNVQVYPFKEGPSMGHMKGLASVVINDQFHVRGLRVMEGVNGLFVGYPNDPFYKKLTRGVIPLNLFVGYPNDPFYKGDDFRSICYPITRQLREHIENCVLEKYQAAIAS